MPSHGSGQEGPESSSGLREGAPSRKGGAHTQTVAPTRWRPHPDQWGKQADQKATPAQAPEPAGPVIELVEITDQDLDSIILHDGYDL